MRFDEDDVLRVVAQVAAELEDADAEDGPAALANQARWEVVGHSEFEPKRRIRSLTTRTSPTIEHTMNKFAVGPREMDGEESAWRVYRAISGSLVVDPAFVHRMGRAAFLTRLVYNAAIDDRVPFADGFAYLARTPAKAAQQALEKIGKSPEDVDLWEINEAFASVAINSVRMLGIDDERVNVNGGAIALGHPIGASGARIVGALIHELRRRGGGLGCAAIWILAFALTRYASLASMLAAAALPVLCLAFGASWPVVAFTAIAAVGVLALHRQNVRRLLSGTEPRFARGAPSRS